MNAVNKRPWYKIRWQIWALSFVSILVIVAIRYQASRPIEIHVTSAPTGQTRTIKDRMIFLTALERSFHSKGWLVSLDLEGENGNLLKIYWESINRSFVKQMLNTMDIIQNIREMGFKRLVLSNGKQEWDIDLKN